MFMSILDTTIVNVAFDTLHRELHSTLSQTQWVIGGYLLALAAVILISGWVAKRFGAKRAYLVSLVLFTLGSALCGISGSIGELIVFRIFQGVGGGMIMPLAMIIMAQVAGPTRMGRVMGIVSMPAMIAPILGPVIGGLILQNLHWSWIFFVNVPIGVIAFALGWRMLPHTDSGKAGRLDVLGLALAPAGAAAIIYGITELGSGAAFGSAKVVVPVLAGLVLLALYCVHALRVEHPLLDIRMYANRLFAGAALTNFTVAGALFGAMVLVPLYYQVVRGQSVVATGLLTGPQGLGALVAMPLASRLTQRFGGGRIALFGVLLLSVSTIPFAFVSATTSFVFISLVLVVRGVSIGMCFMPAMTAAFAAMRPEQVADATPQINALQRTGGAIGVAILTVALQRSSAHVTTAAAHASAFASTYWWALAIAALSVIPCLMLLRAEHPRAQSAAQPAAGVDSTMEPAGA
jgi:EmrB/QacA subfamily drug resistance transporter